MKASLIACLPLVALLGLAAGLASTVGCTDGTTPVCDDAGSCLISPAGDAGSGADGADEAAATGDDGSSE